MFEFFPVIDLKGKTSTQKIDEIEQYLTRLRVELENILGNISAENLSPTLLKRKSRKNSKKRKRRDKRIDRTARQQVTKE